MYAVVDIETTGGSARLERITEIAVYIHDGTRIVEEYSTLVNPERNIPYFITSLTGITNEMVEDAPSINEIIPIVLEFLCDEIIIGHNIRFDLSFFTVSLRRLSYPRLTNKYLDTLSLSKQYIKLLRILQF